MADGVFIKARGKGMTGMLNTLREIGGAVTERDLKSALIAASRPVEVAARRNLRIRLRENRKDTRRPKGRAPGSLIESMKGGNIRVFRKRRRGKGGLLVVGPRWPGGAHGTLLEFRTKRQKPRPFMRPAWDFHARHADALFRRRLASLIDKRARRAAK